ncbi:MAG TPA: D-tyrosyl-tRNA(Tyr) deacylase [Gammaproteobacteria bacterium]|nr:D-tyrosyl-tRNA(Tyr) deacylase [Gammaproteobacteria bacterium]
MIGLIQRVLYAQVDIEDECVAVIDRGILALIGIVRDDGLSDVARLAERILGYRIFPDQQGRMNRSLNDIQGELLLVPQFTLAADTHKGTRPGFSTVAEPESGAKLYQQLLDYTSENYKRVKSGHFGADMQVSLVNDGPVTFWLDTRKQ